MKRTAVLAGFSTFASLLLFGALFMTTAFAAGVPIVTTSPATNITSNSGVLRGTVFPNDNVTTVWIEYGTSSLLGARIDLYSISPQNTSYDVTASLNGLQPNTYYYYRLMGQNSYGTSQGSIVSFSTNSGPSTGNAPIVQTFSAYNLTSNSGTLSGTVNPNGYLTTYWFEYGTSPSLGNLTTSQTIGSGTGNVTVSATLTGLATNGTYYFRVIADNAYGRSQGSIASFATTGSGQASLPTVQTNAATNIFQNTATMNARVHPQGSNTTVWFEYGLSSGSLSTITNSAYIGTMSDYAPTAVTVSNLLPNTSYYFRAVARNNSGTSYGQTLSFISSNSGSGGGGTLYGQPPTVSTGFITLFSGGNIAFSGKVNPQNETATAWFEYGQTQNLGLATSREAVTARGFFGDFSSRATITTGAPYYFRAAAQNRYGTSYGETLTFTLPRSSGPSTPPPGSANPLPPATSTSSENEPGEGSNGECLTVTPSLEDPTLLPGAEYVYTVTYKNNCAGGIQSANLKIVLPLGVGFGAANHPVLSQDGNTVSYDLGAIPGGFQSAIVTRGLVKSGLTASDTLLFKSDLSFVDAGGRTQTFSAYLPATVGQAAGFTGNILDAFRYLLGSWWFWLILIVIVVVFIFYWIFVRKTGEVIEEV